MMGGGMMLGMLLWVLLGTALLVLAGFGVAHMVRRRSAGGELEPSEDPAVAELRRRYAAGEIDEDEYLRRRSGLDYS